MMAFSQLTKYFLSLTILLCLGISSTEALLGNGERCPDPSDASNVCDHTKGLTCKNGACGCRTAPTDMTYNDTLGTCIVFLDGDCAGILTEWPQLPCQQGSWCRYRGPSMYRCTCDSSLSPAVGRKCLPSYYAPCQIDADCNPHDLLKCISGRCNCPRSTLSNYFDYDNYICRSKVAQSCDPAADPATTLTCTPQATCATDATSPTGYRCLCKQGLLPDVWLTNCNPGYNQTCTGLCADYTNLACTDGRCQCQYVEQSWDAALKTCAGDVGDICTREQGIGVTRQVCRTGLTCHGPTEFTNGVLGVCVL